MDDLNTIDRSDASPTPKRGRRPGMPKPAAAGPGNGVPEATKPPRKTRTPKPLVAPQLAAEAIRLMGMGYAQELVVSEASKIETQAASAAQRVFNEFSLAERVAGEHVTRAQELAAAAVKGASAQQVTGSVLAKLAETAKGQ